MEFVRRMYEDGKVTIPKELRDLHGIESGAYVKLSIVEVIPPRARAPSASSRGDDPASE